MSIMIILLAEDNPGDVLLIREAMLEAGVRSQLHVVHDGQSALDFLRGHGPFAGSPQPDLVILDLNLPAKNGREVLAEMTGDDQLNHIPVAVLTSSKTEQDVCQCYPDNRCTYHTKPILFGELVEVIREIHQFGQAVKS